MRPHPLVLSFSPARLPPPTTTPHQPIISPYYVTSRYVTRRCSKLNGTAKMMIPLPRNKSTRDHPRRAFLAPTCRSSPISYLRLNVNAQFDQCLTYSCRKSWLTIKNWIFYTMSYIIVVSTGTLYTIFSWKNVHINICSVCGVKKMW